MMKHISWNIGRLILNATWTQELLNFTYVSTTRLNKRSCQVDFLPLLALMGKDGRRKYNGHIDSRGFAHNTRGVHGITVFAIITNTTEM